MQKFDYNIGVWRKSLIVFFLPKIGKIVESCDHSMSPTPDAFEKKIAQNVTKLSL
jgi:hypothetical protein